MKPVAITPGEPAGIGPDIALKLFQHNIGVPLVLLADRELFNQRATQLGIDGNIPDYDQNSKQLPPVSIIHIPLHKACRAGDPNIANAQYVLNTIANAVQGCMNEQFSALVTGPVSKAIMNEAGIDFPGHTELLAKLTGVDQTVMMLTSSNMRVALLTTHIPLHKVAMSITQTNLIHCIEIIDHDLKHKFGIDKPTILVCGINPHAGESGHLGKEEIEIIIPALDRLRKKGILLTGPISADTAFTPDRLQNFDTILTMYHDQGLPVIKSQGFGNIVNVTLGLPIIRTSVDHGTAFELTGTGKADESSLLAAIKMAVQLKNCC